MDPISLSCWEAEVRFASAAVPMVVVAAVDRCGGFSGGSGSLRAWRLLMLEVLVVDAMVDPCGGFGGGSGASMGLSGSAA
jgi:hypothetical protein